MATLIYILILAGTPQVHVIPVESYAACEIIRVNTPNVFILCSKGKHT